MKRPNRWNLPSMLGEQQGDSSLDSPRAFLTRRGGFNESIVEGQAATDRSNGSMPEITPLGLHRLHLDREDRSTSSSPRAAYSQPHPRAQEPAPLSTTEDTAATAAADAVLQ